MSLDDTLELESALENLEDKNQAQEIEHLTLEQVGHALTGVKDLLRDYNQLQHCPEALSIALVGYMGYSQESIRINISRRELLDNLKTLANTLVEVYRENNRSTRRQFHDQQKAFQRLRSQVESLRRRCHRIKEHGACAQASTFVVKYSEQLYYQDRLSFESIDAGLSHYRGAYAEFYREMASICTAFHRDLSKLFNQLSENTSQNTTLRDTYQDRLKRQISSWLPLSLPGNYSLRLQRIQEKNISVFQMPVLERTQKPRIFHRELELPYLDTLENTISSLEESTGEVLEDINALMHGAGSKGLFSQQSSLELAARRLSKKIQSDESDIASKEMIADALRTLSKDHTATLRRFLQRRFVHHRSLYYTLKSALEVYR